MTNEIQFNVPLFTGKEIDHLNDVIANKKFSGDGKYTKKCNSWLENNCNVGRCY